MTTAQLAMYCKDHFPVAPALPSMIGFSFMQMVEAVTASLAFAGIVGWFAGKRGVSGLKIDLNNVKTDVENIKAKVLPATPVATPGVSGPAI